MRSINEKINESSMSRKKLIDIIHSYMKDMNSEYFFDYVMDELTDEQLKHLADGLDRMI